MNNYRFFLLTIFLYASIILCANSIYVVNTKNGLNVRQKPSTEASVLGKFAPQSEVEVIEIKGDWATILYKGKTAYISSKYIKLKEITTNTSTAHKKVSQEIKPYDSFEDYKKVKNYVLGQSGNNAYYHYEQTTGKLFILGSGTSYSVRKKIRKKIRAILIMGEITSIGKKAFANSPVRFVELPNSLESIGESAFENCIYLDSIYIPANVKSIGLNAFAGCTSLKTIECASRYINIDALSSLYPNVSDIHSCSKETRHHKEPILPGDYDETQYVHTIDFSRPSRHEIYQRMRSRFGKPIKSEFQLLSRFMGFPVGYDVICLYDKEYQDLQIFGNGSMKEKKIYSIPANIRRKIKKVTISDGVTHICKDIISQSQIEEISLPPSIKKIDSETFADCKNLIKVTIEGQNVEIAPDAFRNCPFLTASGHSRIFNYDILPTSDYDKFIAIADYAFERGDYDLAYSNYDKANHVAHSANLYFNMGVCLFNQQRYYSAIPQFEMCIDSKPTAEVKNRALELISRSRTALNQEAERQQQVAQNIFGLILGVTNAVIQSQNPGSVPSSSASSSGSSYSSSSSSSSTSTTTTSTQTQSKGDLCLKCYGNGKCPQCGGTGYRTDNMFGTGKDPRHDCGVCGGSGKCPSCGGAGRK